MAEVQLTAEYNIFAIGQQHTKQPEIIVEGRVDQYPETCQVKSHMLDSSPDNQTVEYSKQSLESENILLKKTVAQFQKDFSRMETHCIALKLKYQNQALKSGQHGQILNETSNKTKIEKEIDVLETMNIELEHSVAKLPQIQEKVFAIVALKNDLRKLKGNITQHYLPKKTESAFAKPDHMIASSSSRNSSKNMPRSSSNDMVHNHYLDEARKKIQEKDRNSKSSVMPTARFQSTTDDSKPKPRNNTQTPRSFLVSKSSCVTITVVPNANHSKSSSSFSDSKNFVCSTCHKCVFNANHDACITKLLKEVNSRAKIQSHKTKNTNKPVDQKSHTQKPGRQILKGHRWIPTGKLFDSYTSKVDSELTHGLNVDILNIHECKQTLDVSACTSINVQKEQSLDLSAENHVVYQILIAVTTADASDKRQQQPDSTSSTSTLATTVTVDGNFDL
ncbi:hypothetical protein Tco_0717336 [Tanacetum coccineum]